VGSQFQVSIAVPRGTESAKPTGHMAWRTPGPVWVPFQKFSVLIFGSLLCVGPRTVLYTPVMHCSIMYTTVMIYSNPCIIYHVYKNKYLNKQMQEFSSRSGSYELIKPYSHKICRKLSCSVHVFKRSWIPVSVRRPAILTGIPFSQPTGGSRGRRMRD